MANLRCFEFEAEIANSPFKVEVGFESDSQQKLPSVQFVTPDIRCMFRP